VTNLLVELPAPLGKLGNYLASFKIGCQHGLLEHLKRQRKVRKTMKKKEVK